jgi:hypothetical protein
MRHAVAMSELSLSIECDRPSNLADLFQYEGPQPVGKLVSRDELKFLE